MTGEDRVVRVRVEIDVPLEALDRAKEIVSSLPSIIDRVAPLIEKADALAPILGLFKKKNG